LKKKISLLVLVLSLLSSKIFSGDFPETYLVISPGIKYAYVFGEEGGSIFGFELAVSYLDANKLVNFGGVLGIDVTENYRKIHFGIEFILPIIAVELGPTYLVDNNDNSYLGYTVSPFITGGWVFPVFSYSNFSQHESIYELGVILKYPFMQLDGKPEWRHALDD